MMFTYRDFSNPQQILLGVLNSKISVKLKNNWEIRGILKSFDRKLTLVVKNAHEYSDGELIAIHDLLLIRGNNVLYIKLLPSLPLDDNM